MVGGNDFGGRWGPGGVIGGHMLVQVSLKKARIA